MKTDDSRRRFLKKAGLAGAGAAGASTLAAPAVMAQAPIKWRLQTYAGAALGEHVIKPAVDAFNKAANGEMEIELYFADQLVPTGRAVPRHAAGHDRRGAVRRRLHGLAGRDLASSAATSPSPPLLLDVPVLFHQYGLDEIWDEAYAKAPASPGFGGGPGPLQLRHQEARSALADLQGKRIFTFPTAGRFLTQFGVVPVTLPWEDIEVAMQTGELDGIAWSRHHRGLHGRLGRRDRLLHRPTTSPAPGSARYFANEKSWDETAGAPASSSGWPASTPATTTASSGTGAARRTTRHRRQAEADHHPGRGMGEVEAAALKFWDEIAAESERKAKVVQIFKDYNAILKKAGGVYTQG